MLVPAGGGRGSSAMARKARASECARRRLGERARFADSGARRFDFAKGLLENRGGRHCQPQRPRRSKSAPEHFRTTLGWYHAPRHVFVLQNSQ